MVVSGPSGAGKSTVSRRIPEALPGTWISVSATTRPPRAGEVEGVDYLFLGPEEFDRRLRLGEFIEWADVHGGRYGTPRAPLEGCLARGVLPVLTIDVQGGSQIRRAFASAVLIFLVPPDLETLKVRLRARGSEGEAEIAFRLQNALREMEHLWEYDYLVVNDTVEQAVSRIVSIVRNEGRRVARLPRDLGWSDLLHRQASLY